MSEKSLHRRRRSVSPLRVALSAETDGRYLPFLKAKLIDAHGMLRPRLEELSVAIVSGRRMAGLHRRFLRRRGATDVLTFELEHDSDGSVVAGEVIVCAAVARREARRQGRKVENELLLYCLHGMLHLCGLDDKTESAFDAMHAKEDEILKRLGVGAVFAPPVVSSKAASTKGASSQDGVAGCPCI